MRRDLARDYSTMTSAPLLFDLDGTLIDSLPDIAASANHLRKSFGLDPAPLSVARSYVGDGVMVLMERCLAELGPFEPHREQAVETYFSHHLEQCTRLVAPYPEVETHLRRWADGGRPMAVVTNKSTLFVHRILDHLELTRYLPVAICGDTLGLKKPDPAPVHEALSRLGVPTDGAMMVGDSLQDLRAGRAAGIRTAAVLFGFSDAAVLRAEGADEYWRSFGEIE